MKKFIVFGISVLLILSSAVILITNGSGTNIEARGTALTKSEVVEVDNLGEELKTVSQVSLPDLSQAFSSGKISDYSLSSISEATDGEIKSLTVDFAGKMDANVDVSMWYSGKSMTMTSAMNVNCAGKLMLGEEAILIDYTTAELDMTTSSTGVSDTNINTNIKMSYPFKIYMDEDTLSVYFKKVSMSIDGTDYSSDVSSMCGRWISLLERNDFGGYEEEYSQMLAYAMNSISAEFNYYADYFAEKAAKNFVAFNGRYYLKESCFIDFFEGLVSKNNDFASNSGISLTDVSYDVLSGAFSMNCGKTEKDISLNANVIASANESYEGASMNMTMGYFVQSSYKLYDENSTVVKNPIVSIEK